MCKLLAHSNAQCTRSAERLLTIALHNRIIKEDRKDYTKGETRAMEMLTTYRATEIATLPELSPQLFEDFISWIDRSPKTTRTYIVNLRQFWTWLLYTGNRRPEREHIILYRQWLESEHAAIQYDPSAPELWSYRTRKGEPIRIKCSDCTVVLYLRSVKQFFAWTAANHLYPNIAESVHAPQIRTADTAHRKRALQPEEVRSIEQSITRSTAARTLSAADATKDSSGKQQRSSEQGLRLQAMYLLAVTAGLRTVELSRANVKDLEVIHGSACLWIHGKGHTSADTRVQLAPEVYRVIAAYLRSRTDNPTGTDPLFVSTGNRSKGKRIATTTISTMLKTAMREAGFDSERLTAHSLRHTAGTTVMELTGRNIYETQRFMRHADPKTSERYIHDAPETDAKNAQLAADLYAFYHNTSEGEQ